jgi:hypothetical protein
MLAEQISNRNFLSPAGFRFLLGKNQKITYFCQSANIPSISVQSTTQPTPFVPLPVPTSFVYDDFNMTFLIDENLENYIILQKWLRGLGVPDSFYDRRTFERENTTPQGIFNQYTDGTLLILNSNLRPVSIVKFEDIFPVSLSTLRFESTGSDTDYFTADVTFKYKSYDVCDANGISLL